MDARFGVLCTVVAGIFGAKVKPGDFFPSLRVELTAEQMEAKLDALAIALCGKE